MNARVKVVLAVVLLALPGAASADSWKDESGRGRGRGEWKQEYRDGNCKIERKWGRNGDYKEEIKCKGRGRRDHYRTDYRDYYRPDYGVPVAPFPMAVAPAPDLPGIACNRDILGGVLGGATGGLLGSRIGKGDGRTAATIGGTLIGAIVGGSIGRSMDQVDQMCAAQALEYGQADQPVVWRNPDGGRYEVRPTRTYRTADAYCREYSTRAWIGGRLEETYGHACRQPDGSWQIVN